MKIGLIGCGRFGQLWSSALASFADVYVYEEKLDKSLINNNKITFTDFVGVLKVDILFLTIPISRFEEVCKKISKTISKNTLIVDVCSVKVYPQEVLEEIFPIDQPIALTHPLFGPDSVFDNNFSTKQIIISKIRANTELRKLLISIFTKLKLEIIEMTAVEHDQCMAKTQALVHFLGRTFQNLNLEEFKIFGPNYDALLKIKSVVNKDTWQLFLDLQRYNPYAKKLRRQFIKTMNSLDLEINKQV